MSAIVARLRSLIDGRDLVPGGRASFRTNKGGLRKKRVGKDAQTGLGMIAIIIDCRLVLATRKLEVLQLHRSNSAPAIRMM